MAEVIGYCVPNVQCKKDHVFTLAGAALMCQEEINAQSTSIKLNCPEPCVVWEDVLKEEGTCPGKSVPATTPNSTLIEKEENENNNDNDGIDNKPSIPTEKPVQPTRCSHENQGDCYCSSSAEVQTFACLFEARALS